MSRWSNVHYTPKSWATNNLDMSVISFEGSCHNEVEHHDSTPPAKKYYAHLDSDMRRKAIYFSFQAPTSSCSHPGTHNQNIIFNTKHRLSNPTNNQLHLWSNYSGVSPIGSNWLDLCVHIGTLDCCPLCDLLSLHPVCLTAVLFEK